MYPKALVRDGFQVSQYGWPQPRHRYRILRASLLQGLGKIRGAKGMPPGQAFVENRTQ